MRDTLSERLHATSCEIEELRTQLSKREQEHALEVQKLQQFAQLLVEENKVERNKRIELQAVRKDLVRQRDDAREQRDVCRRILRKNKYRSYCWEPVDWANFLFTYFPQI